MKLFGDDVKRIHFIGIGGVGMSAIAWILLQKGCNVSGSDMSENNMTRRLAHHGAKIYKDHNAENIQDGDLVVTSTAIKSDNPELIQANAMGLPIWRRAKALAAIMSSGTSIAVAGTHGKTTTTSMLTLVFEKAGLNPTSLIGGELNDIGGNAKLGTGKYIIAEADESDGSFLEMSPDMIIITNVEADHLDYYKNYEEIETIFSEFINKMSPNGLAVVCVDNEGVRNVVAKNKDKRFLTYGIKHSKADLVADKITSSGMGSEFDVIYKAKNLGRIAISVPGQHNVLNSLGVIGIALNCGLDFEKIKKVIKEYKGVCRRFQIKGNVNDVCVVDDYAHHPSEIMATLNAAKNCKTTKDSRIICIFQPHRYSRTFFLADQFGAAFSDADMVIITDVYSAGEAPIENVSGETIFNKLTKKSNGNTDHYIPILKDIPQFLERNVKRGDMVITLGAGNVWQVGDELMKLLV